METQMNIDGDAVRFLRERKAWSQEVLAHAAGLSVRTVQRVESDNQASGETRLALAGALGVTAAQLSGVAPTEAPLPLAHRRGRFWGWMGWAVGGASALIAIYLNYTIGNIGWDEASREGGIICGLLGLCAGLLGALDARTRRLA